MSVVVVIVGGCEMCKNERLMTLCICMERWAVGGGFDYKEQHLMVLHRLFTSSAHMELFSPFLGGVYCNSVLGN